MENLPVAMARGLQKAWAVERQLTFGRYGHVLTNAGVWSLDGDWIVYDVRADPEKFTGTRIERVNVHDGSILVVYESRFAAACGVASFSPVAPVVVFMHGPEHPTPGWNYGFTRRRGVWCDLRAAGGVRPLEAMNYGTRFARGALRGGAHLHTFSPDGRWLSFTYEDEVLSRLGDVPAEDRDCSQRNVGVAIAGRPVQVDPDHPRNHPGDCFAVVVTRTVARPRRDSDEILRATDEAWIGTDGYVRRDGTRQRRALVFQGHVATANGETHAELFTVDLPDDLTVSGNGPIEGTATRQPSPPAGVVQRRLTFTADRPYPGLQGPRHWPRSSPDGSQIAFLMKDDLGVVQFWLVSPNGGTPSQLTRHTCDIASAFTWSPDGQYLAHVLDSSICVTAASTGRSYRLTPPCSAVAVPMPLACVFAPDGMRIAYTRSVSSGNESFAQVFVVDMPPDGRLVEMPFAES